MPNPTSETVAAAVALTDFRGGAAGAQGSESDGAPVLWLCDSNGEVSMKESGTIRADNTDWASDPEAFADFDLGSKSGQFQTHWRLRSTFFSSQL